MLSFGLAIAAHSLIRYRKAFAQYQLVSLFSHPLCSEEMGVERTTRSFRLSPERLRERLERMLAGAGSVAG